MPSLWFTVFLSLSVTVSGINAQYEVINKELQSYLPTQIGKSNFTLNDAKKLLYKKCRKVVLAGTASAQTHYDNIEMAANKLITCANDIADVSVFLADVEAARPTGDLELVFRKYCERIPRIQQCLTEFNKQLLTCLNPAERAQNAIMMHIITSLLDFVCYRDGEQIAIFVAEEGPECLEANKDNISNCMNATFAAYIPATPPTELPELVMGPKQCIDLHDFEECVLSYVEKCNEVTPANIVESLFKYVRNETKCQAEIEKAIAIHESSVLQQRNVAAATIRNVFSWPVYLITVYVLAFNAGVI